jgi:hypothetical protein
MEEKLPARTDGRAPILCTGTCQNCCHQAGSQRLAQIQGDDILRNRALTFSMIVSGWLIVFFSVASLIGRTISFPIEFWATVFTAIVAPWVGVHGGRLFEAISKRIEDNKR